MGKTFDIKALKGLSQDSRQVKKGYLYAALPGSKADGRQFIGDAIRNGAIAILAPTGVMLPEDVKEGEVTLISDDNPRRALALMAAEFYGRQPERVVAVTGTNGKTSIVHFTEQLWASQGYKAASIGTLKGGMTTPGPAELQAQLADLAAAGVTHLALEASSHGLDQYRMDGVKIQAAGFTNLSRDHLDYHGDMHSYAAAKARLFADVMEKGTAVLNADSDEFETLAGLCKERGHKILSYGLKGEELKLLEMQPAPNGQSVKLEVLGKKTELTLPLVGDFQVMNALCALGLVLSEKAAKQDDCLAALENLQGAPGRLQHVGGHVRNAAIYVDYAHTPDALAHVLKALRPHTAGELVCLFGCGGDRDRGKRPLMGQIAADLADRVIVTDDNPRSEDPAQIRGEILTAASGAREIGNRAEAIHTAISELQDGDVLVIAGKGHEQGQLFADRTEPFDDAEEARKAIGELEAA